MAQREWEQKISLSTHSIHYKIEFLSYNVHAHTVIMKPNFLRHYYCKRCDEFGFKGINTKTDSFMCYGL